MAKNTLNANDDLTQIKFTALLKTAVHNKRLNYIEKRNTRLKRQLDFEDFESSNFGRQIRFQVHTWINKLPPILHLCV